jgi:uncharacterized membrane protein
LSAFWVVAWSVLSGFISVILKSCKQLESVDVFYVLRSLVGYAKICSAKAIVSIGCFDLVLTEAYRHL